MRVICVLRKVDYFSKERCKVDLPDPRGPLSSKILPSTIAAANTEIMRVMNGPSELELKSAGEKRSPYNKYMPEFKAKVARYAVANVTIATHNQTLYSSPE